MGFLRFGTGLSRQRAVQPDAGAEEQANHDRSSNVLRPLHVVNGNASEAYACSVLEAIADVACGSKARRTTHDGRQAEKSGATLRNLSAQARFERSCREGDCSRVGESLCRFQIDRFICRCAMRLQNATSRASMAPTRREARASPDRFPAFADAIQPMRPSSSPFARSRSASERIDTSGSAQPLLGWKRSPFIYGVGLLHR
jgi:hypothetical protein